MMRPQLFRGGPLVRVLLEALGEKVEEGRADAVWDLCDGIVDDAEEGLCHKVYESVSERLEREKSVWEGVKMKERLPASAESRKTAARR